MRHNWDKERGITWIRALIPESMAVGWDVYTWFEHFIIEITTNNAVVAPCVRQAQDITLMASWMWSCRINSAEQSIYHFKQRMSSLKNTNYPNLILTQRQGSLYYLIHQTDNSEIIFCWWARMQWWIHYSCGIFLSSEIRHFLSIKICHILIINYGHFFPHLFS